MADQPTRFHFQQTWSARVRHDGLLEPGEQISGTGIGFGEGEFGDAEREIVRMILADPPLKHHAPISRQTPLFHLFGHFTLDPGDPEPSTLNEGEIRT